MKIRPEPSFPMGTDKHTDGRTEMTNQIVPFRNVMDAPKNWS